MEFNDLFNALDRFDKGVKGLQLQRSLEQANQQIEQIRGSELDSVKQQQALRDVAQGLTFQLASSGTPATTIEALTKSFQGEEAKVPTSFEQAILSGNPALVERGITGMNYQSQLIADRQKENFDRSFDVKKVDNERKLFNDFRDKEIKDDLDVLAGARNVTALTGKESKDNAAALGIAVRSLLKASGDSRFSDKDVEGVTPNPDVKSNILRNLNMLANGQPLEADFKGIDQIGKILEKKAINTIKLKADRYTKRQSRYIQQFDRDPAEFKSLLLEGFLGNEQVDQQQVPGQQQQPAAPQRPGLRSFLTPTVK